MSCFERVSVCVVVLLAVLGCASVGDNKVDRPASEGLAQPTLILVSLDGFRWDYVDWPEAANIRQLATRGVRAEGLIPVFPSKTFPCHYSIVTGLYPGNHGIISNNMFDPRIGGEFHLSDRKAVEDSRWWGGEPIWVTAEKQGLKAAAMFWPGSEAEIAGKRPSAWHRFDKAFSFEDRVAEVLSWLDLPGPERPQMITLYFEHPNDVSHDAGPEAPATRAAVREVDDRIGDLIAGLEQRGISDGVDIIVTSDHGMAEVGIDQVVVLDDYLDFEDGELFESGAFVQIFPNPGRDELIYSSLVNAHPELSVYRKRDIPERYHLRSSPRTAPIIAIPSVGWEATTRERFKSWSLGMLKGDHGQDPQDLRMHGLFVAAGPSLAKGRRIARFESVEIYNLMANILGIDPAPNDGDPEWLAPLLVE